MENVFGKDLTRGSILKHLIALSVPMFFGTLLNIGYGIVNSIWVGNLLGKQALAAVTISFPIILLLVSIASGSTVAVSVLVSQHFGTKNYKTVEKVTNNAFTLFLIISVAITAIGIMGSKYLLTLIGAPEEILGIAVSYLRINLIGFISIFMFYVVNAILSGIGDAKTPLLFLVVSTIINAVLDPILIGMMGLNGAAFASLIAQIITFIAGIIYLNSKNSLVSLRLSKLMLNRDIIVSILKIGVPSLVQQCLMPISAVFVTTFVTGFGTNAIAAYGAAGRIDYIAVIPVMAVGMSVTVLTGQNIGAGKTQRVKEILKCGVLINVLVAILISAFVVSMPKVFLHMFTSDAGVLDIGAGYLKVVGLGYVLFAASYVINGIINGSGKTIATMIISFISLCITRIPLAVILMNTKLGLNGIWVAILISMVISLISSVMFYCSGKWQKSSVVYEAAVPVFEE